MRFLPLLLAVACNASPDASPPAPPPAAEPPSRLTEKERIDALIATVEASSVVFIRNGREHDAKKAASHLRRKWSHAKGRIKTAEQFIDKIASRSSMSGKAYQIREEDGTLVNSGDWLRARLEK